jgi:hypothetical protein
MRAMVMEAPERAAIWLQVRKGARLRGRNLAAPLTEQVPERDPPKFKKRLILLERATGIEPVSTAWEAEALYESHASTVASGYAFLMPVIQPVISQTEAGKCNLANPWGGR